MKIGMQLPHSGASASPEVIASAATTAERLGLDSIWVSDRLLRTTRLIPFRGRPPGAMPKSYAVKFDPLETLTYVASLTRRIQLGTSCILALFHSPVALARRFATLDHFSGGRVIAGIGAGWMDEEFTAAGVPMAQRGRRMADFIAAVRAVWGPDPVRYEGRFYTIPESDIGPKPLQPAGIPLLLAYRSDGALKRAARIADGLNPFATWDFAHLGRDIELFRRTARDAGRDPDRLSIILSANTQRTEAPLPDEDRRLFTGTVSQWLEDVKRVADLGVAHVIFGSDDPEPLETRFRVLAEIRERTA
jgi:probable F420-dependent oxidoreductase